MKKYILYLFVFVSLLGFSFYTVQAQGEGSFCSIDANCASNNCIIISSNQGVCGAVSGGTGSGGTTGGTGSGGTTGGTGSGGTTGGTGSGGKTDPCAAIPRPADCAPTQKINTGIGNPFGPRGPQSLQGLFELLINSVIIPIGGVMAVLAFIYSGFLYVMAQGDETKIKTAHRALLYTAIGTAVLLGAAVISKVLTTTINQLK